MLDSTLLEEKLKLLSEEQQTVLRLRIVEGYSFKSDIVIAMEKAVLELSSYHGVIEMSTENLAGEKWMVRQAEIWSEGDKYVLRQNDDTLTVNNSVLLPLIPDHAKQGFDLQDEAKRAKQC